MRLLALLALLACTLGMLMMAGPASALSVAVSQSGSDTDEIMKDRPFTVEVSGWSDSCSTAQISFPECSFCGLSGESELKNIGSGDSVSWTTTTGSMKAAAQKVHVTVSGGCTEDADSSSFDIVLPPSLSVTASGDATVSAGSTFSANLDITNDGETTASDVSMSVSGTGMALSSGGCASIPAIDEGNSAAESCTVTASNAGVQTVTFTATPTNGGTDSGSFQITVTGAGGNQPPTGGSGGGGGGAVSGISETVNIGAIAAGAEGRASFTNTKLSVTEILVTPKVDSRNVAVTVGQNSSRPPLASTDAQGKVYGYLTITAVNIREANITSAAIRFRVNKTWLAANNIADSDVILQRFSSNAWQQLQTSYLTFDSDYAYYSASTPGFSVFAITSKPSAGQPAQPPANQTACNSNGVCDAGETEQNCPADCQPAGQPVQPPTGQLVQPPQPMNPLVAYLAVILAVVAIIIITVALSMKKKKRPFI